MLVVKEFMLKAKSLLVTMLQELKLSISVVVELLL